MSHAKKVISLFSMAAAAAVVSAAVYAADDSVKARIAPIGDVCMSGEDCAAAPAAPVASGPRSGVDVYNTSCMACHATGASGAPKLGDAAAWAPRVSKGMDVLYASAINGLNGVMPPKGMCMDCSDDELKAAVDHMLENSK
ncbi:cytochrome c5 [Pseudoteredinibacter isoporae]|uniref:Cytochrome c5 n=2 Tax=Pseudoteredinibacter isoporae TaxID=570281 RepID=A0A7X0JPN6_9GAMM|nr:cytochrome c5 [Pseudoteredinibacter isoporae]